MIDLQRPDLSEVAPDIQAYVEALEAEVERLRQGSSSRTGERAVVSTAEYTEPATTMNIITLSAAGAVKRTPRHLYVRQGRGGMGVFDLECGQDDHPLHLVMADESHGLILMTDQGRAFRLPVVTLPETPIRSRGGFLSQWLSLQPGEQVSVVFPDRGGSQLHLLSRRGWVRRFSSNIFANLQPGTILYEVRNEDYATAACWTKGADELLVVTHEGKGIRFSERQVPVRGGCLGIRLDRDDVAVSITAVREDSKVFLLGNDGKGTIRLMSGFRLNKAPGAGGKALIKVERLIGAATVTEQDDIFVISRLNKIIRFAMAEVPPKEGVVQGVNCMSLRADEVMSFTSTAGS